MASKSEPISARGNRWKALLERLLPPPPSGISKEQALEIGRRYYEEQGWRHHMGFWVAASAYLDGEARVKTFEVGADTRANDPHVHVRRLDGKVRGFTTTPR